MPFCSKMVAILLPMGSTTSFSSKPPSPGAPESLPPCPGSTTTTTRPLGTGWGVEASLAESGWGFGRGRGGNVLFSDRAWGLDGGKGGKAMEGLALVRCKSTAINWSPIWFTSPI